MNKKHVQVEHDTVLCFDVAKCTWGTQWCWSISCVVFFSFFFPRFTHTWLVFCSHSSVTSRSGSSVNIFFCIKKFVTYVEEEEVLRPWLGEPQCGGTTPVEWPSRWLAVFVLRLFFFFFSEENSLKFSYLWTRTRTTTQNTAIIAWFWQCSCTKTGSTGRVQYS